MIHQGYFAEDITSGSVDPRLWQDVEHNEKFSKMSQIFYNMLVHAMHIF